MKLKYYSNPLKEDWHSQLWKQIYQPILKCVSIQIDGTSISALHKQIHNKVLDNTRIVVIATSTHILKL